MMMPGATLSRWTMSYFTAAVFFLLVAEVLMAAGFGYPAAGPRAPDTLFVVHCITIGWLSLLMLGALFQFVPVLIVGPLSDNELPLPTLVLILSGMVALLASFLQLGGHLPHMPFVFVLATVLLGCGFLLALWIIGRTLASAWPLNLAASFVAIGLASVTATAALGIIFVLGFAGLASTPSLANLRGWGVPLHIIAGLGGWLTFTAMGVSHRLLAMFMLSPELEGPRTRWTFYLGTAALAIVIGVGTAVAVAGTNPNTVLAVAGLAGLGCLGLYGRDAVQLYRKRMRPLIELNSRMAAVALGHLAAATLLITICAVTGLLGRYIGPLLFLVCFGWLTGLGLAKLYKIVAFVTWLECYGPVLGRTVTPRVQDLVVEERAIKWFWMYFAAVDIATLCLLFDLVPLFRLAAALMAIGTAGIALELVRTRFLSNVEEPLRRPEGTHQPRLLFAIITR